MASGETSGAARKRTRRLGNRLSTAAATFVVRPTPPFRLDLTVWALRRRPRNAIDRWDGTTYRRTIEVGGRTTEMAVRQLGSRDAPRLLVNLTPATRNEGDRRYVRSMLERLLGLRIDLTAWYRLAARDTRLRPLAERFRGVKPPRFPTLFEALVNGFACQQLSLLVCLELLNRLAAVCGTEPQRPCVAKCGFPSSHCVANLSPAVGHAIGLSRQKVRALLELAQAVDRHAIDLEALADEDDDIVRERLLELRGVGRWTAEYALLRGLGRLHVFPGDDVGAQKRLAHWLGKSRPLTYEGVRRAVAPWQPYAGLVYFHLLLDGLSEGGTLE
jgi:DNA-3-methyladenine glycosylase II